MGVDASHLFVAGDGRVYRAAVGTAAPTLITDDPSETLWADMGYATVEGVGFESEPSFNEVFAWQSLLSLRQIKASVDERITLQFLQWERSTVITAFGGGTFTEPTLNSVFQYAPPRPSQRDEFALLIDTDDGDDRIRWHFRKVQNTSSIAIQMSRESAAILPVTLKVLDPGGGLDAWYFRSNMDWMNDFGS